jgi:hypothetical protein
LRNNLFFQNEADYLDDGVTSLTTPSAIDAASPGGHGNRFGDPFFADVAGGDFRLLPGSAAIDHGDNPAATGLATDLAGLPRVLDGDGDGIAVVDIGALEADPGTDIDGDRLTDAQEGARDEDLDGMPNAVDADSDGDGLSDVLEAGDANLATLPADTDRDGQPDFLDLDSDNGGEGDAEELLSEHQRLNPNDDQVRRAIPAVVLEAAATELSAGSQLRVDLLTYPGTDHPLVDLYVGLMPPDGSLFFLLADGSFTTAWIPWRSHAPLAYRRTPIFEFLLGSGLPNGDYVLGVAVISAGGAPDPASFLTSDLMVLTLD